MKWRNEGSSEKSSVIRRFKRQEGDNGGTNRDFRSRCGTDIYVGTGNFEEIVTILFATAVIGDGRKARVGTARPDPEPGGCPTSLISISRSVTPAISPVIDRVAARGPCLTRQIY